MSEHAIHAAPANRMVGLFLRCLNGLHLSALAIAPVAARIALAVPFFKSGLTRWDGWFQLSDATIFLFEEQFKLYILGGEYDMPIPLVTAFLVGIAEIGLPILLVLGVGTRLAALALLAMTGVIQLVVPEGWANFHLPWAALALSIMAMGPGPLSIDQLAKKLFTAKL